jgi:hypothetical protein
MCARARARAIRHRWLIAALRTVWRQRAVRRCQVQSVSATNRRRRTSPAHLPGDRRNYVCRMLPVPPLVVVVVVVGCNRTVARRRALVGSIAMTTRVVASTGERRVRVCSPVTCITHSALSALDSSLIDLTGCRLSSSSSASLLSRRSSDVSKEVSMKLARRVTVVVHATRRRRARCAKFVR